MKNAEFDQDPDDRMPPHKVGWIMFGLLWVAVTFIGLILYFVFNH